MIERHWIKQYGMTWREMTDAEKNEMVHICIIGKKIDVPCESGERSIIEHDKFFDPAAWTCTCGATGDMSTYESDHVIPVPNYVGSFDAAMLAVQRVGHLDSMSQYLFYQQIPPLHEVTPEELCWHVMFAFQYNV